MYTLPRQAPISLLRCYRPSPITFFFPPLLALISQRMKPIYILYAIVLGLFFCDLLAEVVKKYNEHNDRTAICKYNYVENNCDTPIPAVRVLCREWGTCMKTLPVPG